MRLLLLLLMFPTSCLADSQFWQSGIDWLKSNLSEDTTINFNYYEFRHEGLAGQYDFVDIGHIIGENFVVNTPLSTHRQCLQTGVCKPKIATSEYQMMPQFRLTKNLALELGMRSNIDSVMSFKHDRQVRLENKKQWFVSVALSPVNASSHYGLKYSSTSLEAYDYSLLRQTSSFSDNALTFFYKASF